jgi:hypothetical protein
MLGMLGALILVGTVVAVPWALHMGAVLRDARSKLRHAMQMFPVSADSMFESVAAAAIIREHAPFLQAQGWSVFRDPIPALLLPSTDQGVPVGEIVAGQPIVQKLRCPVATLSELSILFATYRRQNTSTVSVHLAAGEHTLIDRSFPAAQLVDNTWWTAAVTPPLRDCFGRMLTITVASADAQLGNAITIWTYPRYYRGELSGSAALPGTRVLGLSLNASRHLLAQ